MSKHTAKNRAELELKDALARVAELEQTVEQLESDACDERDAVAAAESRASAAVEAHSELLSRIAADGALDAMERASAAEQRAAVLEQERDSEAERAVEAEAEVKRLIASHDAAVPKMRGLTDRVKRLEEQHKKLGRLIHKLLDWAGNLDCECDQYDDGSSCSACRLIHTLWQTLKDHAAAERAALAASESEVSHG